MDRKEYRFALASGRQLRFFGEAVAHYQDDFYERLKRDVQGAPLAKERVESGACFDIYETVDGGWIFVATPLSAKAHLDGHCEELPAGAPSHLRFSTESALLAHMKGRFNPDDPYCPIRNLLGDWEREDLLQQWIEEAR